jgi:hypothetical protein
MTTVLTQIEACLNSRPLVSLPPDDDGVDALTPGHFLIGRPLTALPDPAMTYRSISVLIRWHLCQALVQHLWQRWSVEYLNSLQRVSKWRNPSRNLHVGDIVVLREDNLTPMNWPLARVVVRTRQLGLLVKVMDTLCSLIIHGCFAQFLSKISLYLENSTCVA